MVDRYWHGQADRISQEAPVPVVHVGDVEDRAGAAANVALNIVSLGARCTLVGVVGDDEAGENLQATLTAAGVECDFLKLKDWQTIVKLRVLAQHQQLIRMDFEEPMLAANPAALAERVGAHLQPGSVLVIEDYDKGTIDDPQSLIAAARAVGAPVVVDPKYKPLDAYRGASVIKPNEREFKAAAGEAEIATAGADLVRALELEGLIVTRGSEGMEVVGADFTHHIPARSVEVFDVTGAGDTTAATLAVGIAAKLSLVDAARVANVAASIAVSKLGTSPVTGPELAHAMSNVPSDRGLLARDDLAALVSAAQSSGEKVVFTNGCFDILHAGHVTYLEEAAALGDRLIVAVNDDASVTALKGPGRPVINVEGRSRVLEGLGCVDWVVSFDEPTPEPLLELLKPDVLVKGGDYGADEVVGAEIVRGYDGEVHVLSLVEDISTTTIVERIKNS